MKRNRLTRFLEILPGAVTWTALLFPFVGAFFFPVVVAIFILIFDLFWIYKSLVMAGHLVSGYRRLQKSQRTDWLDLLEKRKTGSHEPIWNDIYHVVILATYKESLDVLAPSIESIVKAQYPSDRMIFILATEARDAANARANANALRERFGKHFHSFLVTEHPADMPGELKAKGANLNWAARRLQEHIKKEKIDPENVIVTAADADSRFHNQYFAAVTHEFITNPNRHRRSFQPVPLFSNNLWQAPAFSRILAFGSTFWQLVESTRPWRLINFSTHSVSFSMLQEMDFWDAGVVNEDSRQFWRGYFAFAGDHQVVPVFLPVYMDAVAVPSLTRTVKNQYLQRLRWAYGIEHFPYVVTQSIVHKEIPLSDRLIKIYRFFEANFSWATASLFIAFAGWLPILLNREFSQTVLAYNIPFLTSRLLVLTWVGLFISAWLSLRLMPPRPAHLSARATLAMVAQWVLVPVVAILFGSIPAIEAQTRLMLGKYLGFWTTEKVNTINRG